MKRILVLCLFVLVGCSTAVTKDMPIAIPNGAGGGELHNYENMGKDGAWGAPYSGLRLNLMLWDCLYKFSTDDEIDLGGYVFSGVAAGLLLIDATLSGVYDTILLPADLLIDPSKEYYFSRKCLGYGDTWGEVKKGKNDITN